MLLIETEDAPALLAQGRIEAAYGAPRELTTDSTWETCIDGEEWATAWEYVAPPEAPYGEPTHPLRGEMSQVLWLRQPLPPGTCAVHEPRVEGQWEAWANGTPLSFRSGIARVPHPWTPSVLVLKLNVGTSDRGLLEPIRVTCKAAKRPLGSWCDQGLNWYSGRALYSRAFTLDSQYLTKDLALELDLGRVAHCAEIWVNGKLAGTRIWPPYRLDITPYARVGKNQVTVVVANLLANRMRWDIFDDVKGSLPNRKWHDEILRRDAWCFDSGLIGPVEIRPHGNTALP